MGNASTGGNAYIAGGGGAAISAGAGSQNTGTVVFSNSNGISFGLNNGVITATVNPGAAAGIAAVQLPNTTYTSGTVNFINSNGVSFGSTTGGGVTASVAAQSAQTQSNIQAISAGTTSANTGGVVFSNSNGVSFGLNGQTVTASVAASSLSFSNANGVSFGTAGSTLTASVAAQSSLSFSNANNVSFGIAGSTLTASVNAGGAAQSIGVSTGGNTLGNTGTQSGQVVFAGGNNITLSVATAAGGAQTITISGANAGGAQTGISGIQVGNTTYSSGTVTFQNANGISFGSSGANGISASYTVPSTAGLISAINLSAGATSGNLSAVTFSNSNGVSFGLNASTVTASVAAQSNQTEGRYAVGNTTGQSSSSTFDARTLSISGLGNVSVGYSGNALIVSGGTVAGQPVNFSAGTTSNNLGSVVFSNSNGVSFGLNGSTVTGSVAAQSNQTIGVYDVSQSTGQSSSSSYDARSLSFAGYGIISIGNSGGTIQISAPGTTGLTQMSAGISGGNTAGNTGTVAQGQIVFAGGNNVTLSGSTNGSSMTVTISGGAGGSPNFSAGTTSNNLGSVVFSNSNGVSFGLNGSTITGSIAAQTNQTEGRYAVGNTTGQSSSSTFDARTLSISGLGNVSVGYSGSALIISGGTVAGQPVNFSAGTTSNNLGTVVFSNSNGVSFGLNGSTITASAAGGGGAAISAGTQSTNGGTVVFSNSNGISFGMSNSSIVTASYTVPTVTQVSSVGLYVLGNTTQNSSTTLDMRTQSFNALGAMTMGYSNGSIQVSAPATSSLSATGGLSISTNGSTISIGQGALTRTIWPIGNLTAVSAFGNASMSFQYFAADNALTATRMDALMAWTAGSSATTNTCAVAMSMYGAIYTRNGASLSSLSSGSTQTTYSYASNSAGQTQLQAGAIRPLSVPINISLTQGEYFVGFNLVTATSSIGASTTNCPQTFSVMGGNQIQTGLNYNEIASATNASVGLYNGMGVYSAASTGIPAAVSISGIVATGASLSQANFGFVFRNA